jgi:Mrp family chromosome partitioning ATPase/uncharacterized protein involved in exopolysaccharide biosynthesis
MAKEQNPGGPTSRAPETALSEARVRDELEIWELVRRRRVWVYWGLAAGAVLGAIYAFFGSPKYEAIAEIVVVERNPHLPARGASSSSEIEAQVSTNLLSTHVEIVKSKRIVEEALRRNGLENLASIEDARHDWENSVEYVIRKMLVEHGGEETTEEGANVLRITFEHTTADESAAILNAVIARYREFVAETFVDVSGQAIKLIEKAEAELDADLKASEVEYVEFLKQSPLLWSGEVVSTGDKKPSIPQQRVASIEERLATVKARKLETQSRLRAMEEAMRDPNIRKADGTGLALLGELDLKRVGFYVDIANGDAARSEAFHAEQSARLESLRAEYDRQLALLLREYELASTLGKDHIRVRQLGEQQAALSKFIEQRMPEEASRLPERPRPESVLAAYVNMLRYDLAELEHRDEQLEQLEGKEIDATKEIVSFEVRGELMREEMSRKRRLFDAFVDRLRDTNLIKDYGGYLTEVITPVEKGKLYWLGLIEMDFFYCTLLSIVAGSFVGGCMGSVGGVFRHLTDDTFGRADEVQKDLGLPILAHIDQDQVPGVLSFAPEAAGSATTAPNRQAADAYRELRNALFLLLLKPGRKVLEVVGPGGRGEDRSKLVANLGVAFAQAGRKTLIVDCDLRSRRLSRMFSVDSLPDVAQPDSRLTGWAAAMSSTPHRNLWVLPAADLAEEGSDFYVSPGFKADMESMRSEFDVILFDCDDLLSSSDAVALANHADAAILAFRIGRNERLMTIRARDALLNLDVEVLGAVVIGADDGSASGYRELRPVTSRRTQRKKVSS